MFGLDVLKSEVLYEYLQRYARIRHLASYHLKEIKKEYMFKLKECILLIYSVLRSIILITYPAHISKFRCLETLTISTLFSFIVTLKHSTNGAPLQITGGISTKDAIRVWCAFNRPITFPYFIGKINRRMLKAIDAKNDQRFLGPYQPSLSFKTPTDNGKTFVMLTEDEWPMLLTAKQLWQPDDLREENCDRYKQLIDTTDCPTQVDR